jgi:hypothetical protein
MKKFLTVMSLLAIIATPAFAASIHHRAAQSLPQLFMYAPSAPSAPSVFKYAPSAHNAPDAARSAAIRECNIEASKFSDAAWETTKSAVYGTWHD